MGIHLFIDKEDHRGHQYKDYTIHSDPLVTAWQCRRECVRHRGLNIDQDNAIACVQWLCTDEEHTPFQWLYPKRIPYGGQPLHIGVPGAGFDRRQAVRALGDRSALARASARFRVACDIRCVS